MTLDRTWRSAGSPWYAPGADQAACAVVAAGVPAAQRRDRDAGAGVRRVDEATAAHVEADVTDPVEEEEVSGAQACARDAAAEVELAARVVRQRDPEVRVDEPGEARAVEARARRRATVA